MRNKEDYFQNDNRGRNGGGNNAAFSYNLGPQDKQRVNNYSRNDRKVNFNGDNDYNYVPPRDEKTATERMYENQGR